MTSAMRPRIHGFVQAQLRRNGLLSVPSLQFHASSTVLAKKPVVIGNPSPIRPPTPVPPDHSAAREYRKIDFDEYIANLDTTLTDEQKEFVAKIKRQIKGPKARPSEYRDVPLPEELGILGHLKPDLPENAEALVDWALSHAPKKAGPRKSRKKRRALQRQLITNAQNAKKREEKKLALLRRKEKNIRTRKECQRIKEEAVIINAQREAKLRAAGLLKDRLSA